MEGAKQLFSNRHGVSTHYSRRIETCRENTIFKQHFIFVLGKHMQDEDDPSRIGTNAPRTLYVLHLRPSNNLQFGYELLHLKTNKIINHRKAQSSPATTAILNKVHILVASHKMPKGLKIKNRAGYVLLVF